MGLSTWAPGIREYLSDHPKVARCMPCGYHTDIRCIEEADLLQVTINQLGMSATVRRSGPELQWYYSNTNSGYTLVAPGVNVEELPDTDADDCWRFISYDRHVSTIAGVSSVSIVAFVSTLVGERIAFGHRCRFMLAIQYVSNTGEVHNLPPNDRHVYDVVFGAPLTLGALNSHRAAIERQ